MIREPENQEYENVNTDVNTASTVMPDFFRIGSEGELVGSDVVNSALTVMPASSNQTNEASILLPGEAISDGYIIHSALNTQGSQSNVYLAKKYGKSFVVKSYHKGWQPSDELRLFLSNVKHPNIASVVDQGMHGSSYYEIYEYYSEGTLEERAALSSRHISMVIVPSINEGLYELHQKGIVHCDIKPSNLFYADGENRLVIGDCGVSAYTNSNKKLIDTIRGTPEYAPPVKSLLWSAVLSPAYDYGSFGLVLCKAILGYSLFQGMSVEQIARAWEDGIVLPNQISGRLGNLIRGLISKEEEERWGYEQVKRWCEGEFISVQNPAMMARKKRKAILKPLVFGCFDGSSLVVNSLHQLANAIRKHWDQAARLLKKRALIDFLCQFDKTYENKVRELVKLQDVDEAVYKLLMYVDDDTQSIHYCGRDYASLMDYVDNLSTGRDGIATKFLSSGLLIFYLRYNEYDKAKVDELESLIGNHADLNMSLVSTICYALQGKKTLDVYGHSISSLDELVPLISSRSMKEIGELIESDSFLAWLVVLGYEKEAKKMREGF